MNRLRAVFLWATDMSRNNTGNPIGSGDPRDREDNSKNLDQAMNSAGSTWTDRLGVTRKTFKAAENAADAAEAAANTAINTTIPGEVARVTADANTAIDTEIPFEVARVESDADDAINTEIPAEVARVTADANTAIGTEIPFEVNRAKSRADTAIDTEIPAQVQRATDYVETILEPETSDALDASIAKSALRAEAARDAATVNAQVYASTSAAQTDSGLPNGSQYQVVSADGLQVIRYRKDSSSASTELVRYPTAAIDTLTVNKGKDYPLKAVSRASVVSPAPAYFPEMLIGIKVIGAVPGKYYRVAYFQNGVSLGSTNDMDWVIEVGDKATFDSTGATTVLIGWQDGTYGPQEQLVRNSGIQTINLYTVDKKVNVQLTVDTNSLPPAGITANALTSERNGYSWTIDPSCYIVNQAWVDESLESLESSINGLADSLPEFVPAFRNVEREGVLSAERNLFRDVIVDVVIEGAEYGYYYSIKTFKNGVTSLAGPPDGWAIEKIAISEYATTAYTAALAVINFTDPAPDIDRSIGIQTITLKAPNERLLVHITLDASKLQAYGSVYRMAFPSDVGYSWIIDPSRYKSTFPAFVPDPEPAPGSGPLEYIYSSTGELTLSWKDKDRYYRWTFGPNGVNDLPNFKGLYASADGLSYAPISTFGTDWLPPMTFNVTALPPHPSSLAFTGGNHLLFDVQTAINRLYLVMIDGAVIQPNEIGACQSVSVVVVNDIMAANTIDIETPRYAARQSFLLHFVPGICEVSCDLRALEEIEVKVDYGPQLVGTGLIDTQLFVNGQYADRVAFDSNNTSGAFSSYPDAWAVILQSDAGQLASWLDHSYGIGDGQYVGATEPRIRGSGAGGGTKMYHAAVRNLTSPALIAAGESYKWRGGYSLSAPGVAPAGFDSVLSYLQDGKRRQAWFVDANDYVSMP